MLLLSIALGSCRPDTSANMIDEHFLDLRLAYPSMLTVQSRRVSPTAHALHVDLVSTMQANTGVDVRIAARTPMAHAAQVLARQLRYPDARVLREPRSQRIGGRLWLRTDFVFTPLIASTSMTSMMSSWEFAPRDHPAPDSKTRAHAVEYTTIGRHRMYQVTIYAAQAQRAHDLADVVGPTLTLPTQTRGPGSMAAEAPHLVKPKSWPHANAASAVLVVAADRAQVTAGTRAPADTRATAGTRAPIVLRGHGSGIFLDPVLDPLLEPGPQHSTVLTAFHPLYDADRARTFDYAFIATQQRDPDHLRFQCVADLRLDGAHGRAHHFDSTFDFALLKCTHAINGSPWPSPFGCPAPSTTRDEVADQAIGQAIDQKISQTAGQATKQPIVGAEVHLSGYPAAAGGALVLRSGRRIRSAADEPPSSTPESAPSWTTDALVEPGMSGGPVFDADGRLIGMISGQKPRWLVERALPSSATEASAFPHTQPPSPDEIQVQALPPRGVIRPIGHAVSLWREMSNMSVHCR